MSNSTLNNLEDNTFQCVLINQDQLQQICSLVDGSFMKFDPIYKKHVNTVQLVQSIKKDTKHHVLQSIRQNLAFGLKLIPSNKIVGVLISLDITTLKQIHDTAPGPQSQSQQKLWNVYNCYAQLQSILMDLKGFQKGDACYGLFLAIDSQFQNYHLGALCTAFTARRILFDMGYKSTFSINYNPVSIQLAVNFGGRILAKRKDQQQNLQFCLLQMKSQLFEILNIYLETQKQKTLKQMKKKPKSQTPKSKL